MITHRPTTREQTQEPQIQTVWFPDEGQQFGSLNKPSNLGRWTIGDTDFDDLVNFISYGKYLQQVPGLSIIIATLAAPAVWISAQPLNLATYLFCLCTNGHIYQVSLGGVITDIHAAGGFSTLCDIANWQGNTILISDVNQAKVFSWDGTTFATPLSGQPATFITVFSGRLWLANNNSLSFTAAGTFNSVAGDAGSLIMTDYDTPPPIKALVPFQGSLYIFGYNWVQIVGNLFDTGNPAVLQLSRNSVTDEAGIINKWSVMPYGYSLLYSSLYGLWSLYGAQASFISEMIGGFFQNLVVGGSTFSAAFGPISQLPCVLWNIQWNNNGTNEYTQIGIDTASLSGGTPRFFRTVFGNINFITYGVDQTNGQQKIWGVDTSGNLTQMYVNSNTIVTSIANTKMWNFGTRIRIKEVIRVGALVATTSPATLTFGVLDENQAVYSPDNQTGNPVGTYLWQYSGGSPFNWQFSGGAAFIWAGKAINGILYNTYDAIMGMQGRNIGINFTITGVGAGVNAFGVEYVEVPADWE